MASLIKILRPLSRPFSYMTIRHEGSGMPSFVNWIIPFLLAVPASIAIEKYQIPINIWGDSGIVSKLLGFFQSLPGFYIAALAAIATFGNSSLDKIMPGTPPTMDLYRNGNMEKNVPITRRIFLSSMFSYLTALSILLTLAAIVFLSIATPALSILPECLVKILRYIVTPIYFLLSAQLICVTFWGLYYLGERIHLD